MYTELSVSNCHNPVVTDLLTAEQDGFATVHYQLFSLPQAGQAALSEAANTPQGVVCSTASGPAPTNSDIFWKAESRLRERGALVHVDTEEQELWLFQQPCQKLANIPRSGPEAETEMLQSCGVALQCTQSLTTP